MDSKRQRSDDDDMQIEEPTNILICESDFPYSDVKVCFIAYQKDNQLTTTLVVTFYPEQLFDYFLPPELNNKIKLTNVCYHPCDVNLVNDIMQWYCSLDADERYDAFALSDLAEQNLYHKHIERPVGKYSLIQCSCLDGTCLNCRFGYYTYNIFDNVTGTIRSLVVEKILNLTKEIPFIE